METDRQFLVRIVEAIRFPKDSDNFDHFRNRLLGMILLRRQTVKQEERRREAEHRMFCEMDRRSREALRRRQEETTMWRGYHSEKE